MTIQYTNLKDLKIARENTRKSRSADDVKILAESIMAVGLLHTLVGYEDNGTVYITDGGSRLKALRYIETQDKDESAVLSDIPVNICLKDQAVDISLSANLVRNAMSPADQFTAFHKLHYKENVSIADIAKRYYVDSQAVRRILKLASLAKPIFTAFKKGDLSLDTAKTYAGCDNTDRQVTVFKELGSDASIHTIRAALRQNTYLADSPRVDFVSLEAYLEKGGVLEDDLFDQKTVLVNGEIIDALMVDAIEAHTQSLLGDGWSDVQYFDCRQTFFDACQSQGNRIWKTCTPNKKQQEKLDELSSKIEALGYYWGLEDNDRALHDQVSAQYDAVEQEASSFTIEEMQNGICLWHFDEGGAQYQTFALPEETVAQDKTVMASRDYPESFERAVFASAGDALMEHLTIHPNAVTTALAIAAIEFSNFPTVNLFKKSHPKLKFMRGQDKTDELASGYDDCPWNICAVDMLERLKVLVAMTETQRQSILAKLIRDCLTMGEQGSEQHDQLALFEYLSEQGGFTLTDYWTFGEDELKSLNKSQLLRLLETMGLNPKSFDKAKKSELVTVTARYAAEQNWTPEFIRVQGPELPCVDEKEAQDVKPVPIAA